MLGGVRRRCYMLKCIYIRRKGPVCWAECEDGATIYIYIYMQLYKCLRMNDHV